MRLYAVFIDHASSTLKLFGFWLTWALHLYFWPHNNFFQWQRWLSQPFCSPLLIHPITKIWLLILLPITSSAEPVQPFIWSLGELIRVKNHKNKTHWLIFLPRTIPQLVHSAAHKLNTRTSVLDKSTGPFGLLSCTQQAERTQQMCKEGCKNRASTQEWSQECSPSLLWLVTQGYRESKLMLLYLITLGGFLDFWIFL